MKLNIAERIALMGVLPQQGNAVTLRIIRDLRGELSFTEEELERYGIENHQLPDGRTTITWNPKLSQEELEKDITIGKAATSVVTKELMKLDAQNRLHVSMLPLYEKFVEDKV